MSTTTPQRKRTPAPAADPPHPRIRARRIEVRRDEGRRRRNRLLALAAVAVLLAVVVGVAQSPLLDVDRVQVVGAARVTDSAVVASSGVKLGDPMIRLDNSRAARAIEALPWVRKATISRRWPGTMRIEVTERKPIAQVADGANGFALVDASGRVLTVLPRPTPAMLTIAGVAPGQPGALLPARARPALDVAGALRPSLAKDVATIGVVADGIDLTLREGIAVRLGPINKLPSKLQALEAILDSATRDCPIDTIDVLVPSAPVLTRKQGCA